MFKRFQQLSTTQKILTLFGLVVGVLLIYLAFNMLGGATIISSPLLRSLTGREEEKPSVANPINGVLYKPSEAKIWQERLPLAVMVENLVDIRPQSGLSSADLVYEAQVEGGITRFMAVYLAEDADEIGPVRSSREYYLDWSAGLGALYAHIGGSPAALDRIYNEGIKTLPEELPYYTRKNKPGLSSEHTAFTSTKNLWQMAKNRGFSGSQKVKSWKFKDDATSSARPASSAINIQFNALEDYSVKWNYDPETNLYSRFNDPNTSHTDKVTTQQIMAKNVIIEYADHSSLRDDKNRIDIETIGTGEAKIFLDGQVIEAEWRKSASNERTRYYDQDGNEVFFNRGKIWVEVVPESASVEYS